MHEGALIPRWLAIATRLQLGASFVFSDHGSGSPGELSGFLTYARQHAFHWYSLFLGSVVIPRTHLLGPLIVAAELCIGIAMILGLCTRLAAVGTLFLLANYLCAKGRMPWNPGIDPSDIMLALVVLFSAAGRFFGIDSYLHKRFPGAWMW